MGDTFGGRYSDPALLLPDGMVDYRKVQKTEWFNEGINLLFEIINTGKAVAIMCAEKEPEKCHRFSLISPDLLENGVSVIHIRPDRTV
jgi:uncharacterized protein (DUF488 family)